MENVHPNAIPHIERALGIKLYENQKNYLLGTGSLTGGRGTGKTTAYCIALATSGGEPLDLKKPEGFADEWRLGNHREYARGFFKNEFMRIRGELKDARFKVREVRNEGIIRR